MATHGAGEEIAPALFHFTCFFSDLLGCSFPAVLAQKEGIAVCKTGGHALRTAAFLTAIHKLGALQAHAQSIDKFVHLLHIGFHLRGKTALEGNFRLVAVHREIGQVFIIGLQIPQDAGQSRGRPSIGLPDRQCDDVRGAAGRILGNGEIVALPAAVKQGGFGVPGKIVLLGKIPQGFWQFMLDTSLFLFGVYWYYPFVPFTFCQ